MIISASTNILGALPTMSDSITTIFERALERQGVKLSQNQISIVLTEVENCGVL
jgi:hypothetical protein